MLCCNNKAMHLLPVYQKLYLSSTCVYACYRIFQCYSNITSFCSMLLFGAIFQVSKAVDALLIHYSCSCPKNVILVLSSFPRAGMPPFSLFLFYRSSTFLAFVRTTMLHLITMSAVTWIINHLHFISHVQFALYPRGLTMALLLRYCRMHTLKFILGEIILTCFYASFQICD